MWARQINDGKILGCVLIDFRKSFDLVDHKLLRQNVEQYKINDLSLSWFESYLSYRTQQVTINVNQSKSDSVLAGVP